MSLLDIDAAATRVVGKRPGDLLRDNPLRHHSLVLDSPDETVVIGGTPAQLDVLAHAVRREVDALTPAGEHTARPEAGTLPPTLDYLAIDPDGRIRLVSAILGAGGTLPILQSAVGGYIEIVRTAADLDGFANEEGLLLGLPYNRMAGLVHQRLTGSYQPIDLVGTLVFVGTDGEESLSLTAEQRLRVVEAWLAVHREL